MKHLAVANGVDLTVPGQPLHLLCDLRDEADRWLVVFVRDCVEEGRTWAEIGEWLGVSRQSAHERFSPRILELANRAVQKDPEPT